MWLARWGGSSSNGGVVADRFLIALGLFICALVALDLFANGGEVLVFLSRRIIDLTEYLIFWR